MKKIDWIKNGKFAIWGTGKRCERYLLNNPGLPEFFIDNDEEKAGTAFHGRCVINGRDVADIKKYFIVVAVACYDEIKTQLLDMGLAEGLDFASDYVSEDNKVRIAAMIKELEDSKRIFSAGIKDFCNRTLIFGGMLGFSDRMAEVFETFSRGDTKSRFAVMSELKLKNEPIGFPFLILPEMLLQANYLRNSIKGALHICTEHKDYVMEEEYREEARKDFLGKYPDADIGYSYTYIYEADTYLRFLIEQLEPDRICMWNEFYPFHHLLKNICTEKGIDTLYLEFGVLPGTFQIERMGQMGESFPAQKWQIFKKLPISNSDIKKAKDVYEYLRRSKANRHVQPESEEIAKALSKTKPDRPLVVYYGQNDYESGMYPYGERAKRYHSPIFSSSHEAAFFLSEIADRNGWNFIYKPHPLCLKDINEESDFNIIKKCDINELTEKADLNITILSTTAYVSLIRHRPILMLGYTQLYHSDCTYEAFGRNEIEAEMKRGIQCGYTDKQKIAFEEHMARLIKYYVFDDEGERDLRYGRELRGLLRGEKLIDEFATSIPI